MGICLQTSEEKNLINSCAEVSMANAGSQGMVAIRDVLDIPKTHSASPATRH